MSNILITGGAGYIGSALIPDLLAKGHQLTVIDNFMYKQTSIATEIRNKKLDLIFGDVRDEDLMKKLLKNADIIIPLAAIVGAPACDKDPMLAKAVNRDSLLRLFKQVSTNQRIIMPTTNSAYGSGDVDHFCDENSPLNPISTYAQDKVLIEKALTNLENFTSFRLATVFGLSTRMRLDLLVNNFVFRALTDKFIVIFEGHFKRNYIHILDVVSAFNLAIDNAKDFSNQIFNVGLSDANISKKELCEEIKKFVKDFIYLEAPLGKDPDQRNYIVSNKKIENLGFKARYSLQDGISELVKGLKMYDYNNFSNA